MFSLPRVSRKTIFVLLFLGIIQVSCTNPSSPAQSFAERACIDSLVRANRNLDSMEIWLEKFSREQNHIGLHCCPEKFYHKVGCSTEPASGTLTGVVG